jgi:hypothetical protein
MALSRLGNEMMQQAPRPTLPVFNFKNGNPEREAKEDTQHRAMVRTVKAGQEAWSQITKAESFEAWARIGAALSIGKAYALRVTGANQAWGSAYSKAFSEWMTAHGFGKMPKPVRSHSIELHENISAIEQWRATLSEQQRRKLQGPQWTLRRWKRDTGQVTQSKRPCDTARAAMVAFNRFVSLVQTLPDDQAAPLWQVVHAQAAEWSNAHA